jgi:raffinose/stachyose/melibiose transport system permease protein
MRTPKRERIPGTVLMIAAMLFAIFPILSMLCSALAPQGTTPLGISWPAHPQWQNFIDAWNAANITTLLGSSAILVLGVVPATVLFAAMAGYALGSLRIPGGTVFFVLLLLGLTLPFEVTIIPLYYQIQDMGLLNTRLGLILPLIGLNMPFAIFWMRAHFVSVPKDLTEAAGIDGAGAWRTFQAVHLPLSIPSLSALALLTFVSTWNQFLLAIVLLNDPDKRTMAGALQNFVGQHTTNIPLLNAGALILLAPMIAVFLIFQRQFVRAMFAGSLKS